MSLYFLYFPIDIECSLEMDLYSIAIYGNNLEAVLMVDPDHRDKERNYQNFGRNGKMRSNRNIWSSFPNVFDNLHIPLRSIADRQQRLI